MPITITLSKRLMQLALLLVLAAGSASLALATHKPAPGHLCGEPNSDPEACQLKVAAAGRAAVQLTGGYRHLLPLVSRSGAIQDAQILSDYVVTKTGDTDDGICDGDCSLREAVAAANSSSGADVIGFAIVEDDPGCSAANVCTLALTAEIGVNGADVVAIDGIGEDITINGNNASRLIRVHTGAALSLRRLILTNGSAGAGVGGAIINFGWLSVSQSTFSGNSANAGGAIYNYQGSTVTISHSAFDQNNAEGFGGAIISYGPMAISHSTFSGNGGDVTYAGAIDNWGPLAISNSTFSGNSADRGGAIANQNVLEVRNSTFAGNSALINGSTIANYPQSGGIVSMHNSLLSGSDACDEFNIDTPAGGNLSDDSSCTASPVDLRLGPLGDHGGPTLTHALLPDSPAIDAGVNNCADATGTLLASDQRDMSRPMDGDGDGLARCDIGAYETNRQVAPDFVVNASGGGNDGSCDAFVAGKTNCTLREAVAAANESPGNDTITFAIPEADPGCSLANVCTIILANELTVSDAGELTIDGAAANITVSGDHSSRIIAVDAGAILWLQALTLANGSSSEGGAIHNKGSVAVNHIAFLDNSAANSGGAIHNETSLIISSSTFSGSSAGQGGAIGNRGSLTVSHSGFSDNSASGDGGAILNLDGGILDVNSTHFAGNNADTGGAIRNMATGSLNVNNSTFSGNEADFAGAIGNLGRLTIGNSTFSGNGARLIGGAIRNSGTLHLGNSTFFGRIASPSGGTLVNFASLSMGNSILAGNAACGGSTAIVDNGGNLSDDGSCPGFTTADLLLGPLADNGGPTLTHALLAGSPAVDAGVNECPDPAGVPLATDQRGVARPQGAACDVGAFELQNSPPLAEDDAYSTPEDTPVLIEAAANDSDADGNLDPSSAALVSGPDHGSVADRGDGNFTYTPEADFYGGDSFVYQICDTAGLCDQATVRISVVPVNDPPLIEDGDLSLDAANIQEMESVNLSGVFTDPEAGDSHSVTINWGDSSANSVLTLSSGARSFSATHQYLDDNPSGTAADENVISVTVADVAASGTASARVTVNNVAPAVGPIGGPATAVNINDLPISITAVFTDPGVLDIHTAAIEWGDGSADNLSLPAGSRDINGSHVYDEPGVYEVSVRVTDDDLGTGEALFQYLIIYDAAGGFITGGGWIDSPAGAYQPDPSLVGKAHFGFVSRYRNEAADPSGSAKFHLQTGDLNFQASSYDWLVIAGAKATYQGIGTVNGGGRYGFMLSAIDAALTSSNEVDRFRMRIWDMDDGDAVIYDNQVACPDTAVDADPCSPLGSGAVAIHSGKP